MGNKFNSKSCRLLVMMVLTSTFFLAEIIVGYITKSMALVADSFHMLSDVVALFVGLFAVRISKRRSDKNTFGWARAEVLGALVNAVFLLALCFSILVESLKRIIEPEKIENAILIVGVGSGGLFLNLVGLFLFRGHGGHGHSHGGGGGSHGHSHANSNRTQKLENGSVTSGEDNNKKATQLQSSTQMNMRGVYLHVLGDTLGSVIVVISGLMIYFIEENWVIYIDPGMSILMVIIIMKTTIPLLKESSLILLQTVPTHINVEEVQERLLDTINGVLSIHEFHVWQLAGNRIIASCHIKCRTPLDYVSMARDLKNFFHELGIHSTTIQPEFEEVIVCYFINNIG
ncbi:uncharacterized protein TRIADDRAFT_20152 [Trichoplax adhaerens]|uniref:Zinc transporter 1 n=1 Tax=Trichoplax adhaerens TaxID=10228 RepID=B3RLV5_TRIAD|nr:hypothetical protein TRIADDRAFT_20152 [Trichoplax adhaerens]EDV28852.1 hypothetical protein TRIADDRAFT_20152 [Trichoplax adhaerens]|eukprot:XP_002108054.1 hypothetical protein TRIADDRAFT_20152 [Trichoplax adhaerens]